MEGLDYCGEGKEDGALVIGSQIDGVVLVVGSFNDRFDHVAEHVGLLAGEEQGCSLEEPIVCALKRGHPGCDLACDAFDRCDLDFARLRGTAVEHTGHCEEEVVGQFGSLRREVFGLGGDEGEQGRLEL